MTKRNSRGRAPLSEVLKNRDSSRSRIEGRARIVRGAQRAIGIAAIMAGGLSVAQSESTVEASEKAAVGAVAAIGVSQVLYAFGSRRNNQELLDHSELVGVSQPSPVEAPGTTVGVVGNLNQVATGFSAVEALQIAAQYETTGSPGLDLFRIGGLGALAVANGVFGHRLTNRAIAGHVQGAEAVQAQISRITPSF